MRPVIGLVALVLSVPLVDACEVQGPDCTKTTMDAHDASKVDLVRLGESAVLTAHLETKKDHKPLLGQPVTFTLLRDDTTLYSVDTRADRHGDISYDLKGLNARQLVAVAKATTFEASFDGDGTYCSSSDDATFSTLRKKGVL